MKYYYKKKRILLNAFCITFFCYFWSFYSTLRSLLMWSYDKDNKPLLSTVIMDYPRSMTNLTCLLLIGSIVYLFFSWYLESKNSRFIYLENIPKSNVYKYYLKNGLSYILKLHISIYTFLSLILCFFYKVDLLSIDYYLLYIIDLTVYLVFLYNIGYILLNKRRVMPSIMMLSIWISSLTLIVDIVLPLFTHASFLPIIIFNPFINSNTAIWFHIIEMIILNTIMYLHIKRKDYLYLYYS